jgi:hypothetical protein
MELSSLSSCQFPSGPKSPTPKTHHFGFSSQSSGTEQIKIINISDIKKLLFSNNVVYWSLKTTT